MISKYFSPNLKGYNSLNLGCVVPSPGIPEAEQHSYSGSRVPKPATSSVNQSKLVLPPAMGGGWAANTCACLSSQGYPAGRRDASRPPEEDPQQCPDDACTDEPDPVGGGLTLPGEPGRGGDWVWRIRFAPPPPHIHTHTLVHFPLPPSSPRTLPQSRFSQISCGRSWIHGGGGRRVGINRRGVL